MAIGRREALDYHESDPPGKIGVVPTKPTATQRDLSLAYTPGVAFPCLEIARDPEASFKYTNRGNLVAVVSNGSAVLGLGKLGATAAKPVMEGKGVLFKRFAGIDVFDLVLDTDDPNEIVRACEMLEPNFGGINLEDIKAPECFEVERRLREKLQIPVFHDDQHGTALISGAGLINALELVGKKAEDVTCAFFGAGAAGIACAELFLLLGVRRENILLCDSKGVCHAGRTDGMNAYKRRFATESDRRTLADAVRGADVFVGVSQKGLLTPEMLRTMADRPIVFAMANPDPEISYPEAMRVRDDAIVATGRSDYPNQVNNVLGFPFIFRGALDVRARAINEEMKIACARALASLAKEDVPDSVLKAYGVPRMTFGPEYIIPKPFDPRVLLWAAPAVAQAATDTGVARRPIGDIEEYRIRLRRYLGPAHRAMNVVIHKAQSATKRIVFPEGETDKIIRAAPILVEQRTARPILIGREDVVRAKADELGVDLEGVEVVSPLTDPRAAHYATQLYQLRSRKGVTPRQAAILTRTHPYFGLMMVREGEADGCVLGLTMSYAEAARYALRLIGLREGVRRASGVFILILDDRILVASDTVLNIEPSAPELAEIAILAADVARYFDLEPRVAMLSYSNFGSVKHAAADRVAEAARLAQELRPDLVIDGEMHVDVAFSKEIAREAAPISRVQGDANVLVFPDLSAGNIGYKLIQHVAHGHAMGPMIVGLTKPVNLLGYSSTVADVVNAAALTAVGAEELTRPGAPTARPDRGALRTAVHVRP